MFIRREPLNFLRPPLFWHTTIGTYGLQPIPARFSMLIGMATYDNLCFSKLLEFGLYVVENMQIILVSDSRHQREVPPIIQIG